MVSTVKGHTWVTGILEILTSPNFAGQIISPPFPLTVSIHTVYKEFIDLLNEFSLTQLVTQSTMFENILDLFLIDNPTLVKSVDIKSGILFKKETHFYFNARIIVLSYCI